MASKKDKEKIDIDMLYVSSKSSSSMISYVPPIILPPIYVPLPAVQHLFSIEKHHPQDKSPREFALSYFPPDFYWIPEDLQKDLEYYTNILFQTESIRFHPMYSKNSDSLIVRGNIAYIVKFIHEKDWGLHPSTLRPFAGSAIPYSYYDYITAWSRFILLQTPEFTHCWIINFDKNFDDTLPIWFLQWWRFFGLNPDTLPPQLIDAFHLFKTHFNHKEFDSDFPPILHFVKKYKIPWFMRWKYVKRDAKIERHWYQAKLKHNSPKIDAIVKDVKQMAQKAQSSKASSSFQISPHSAFSRYSKR
jgi:hypothetical protein